MKGMWWLRAALVAAGAAAGAAVGEAGERGAIAGALFGAAAAAAVAALEARADVAGTASLLRAGIFLGAGLAVGWLVSRPVELLPIGSGWKAGLSVLLWGGCGYLAFAYALKNQERFTLGSLAFGGSAAGGRVPKIVDTSVIIDGRIAEVCDTGFLDGPFIVPRFVLQELQRISDSGDPVKRGRGRRALDILNRLMRHDKIDMQVSDRDFPEIAEVDEKLVAMAKAMRGKVLTNDYNLNKVAAVQQVPILNLNDLAGALKPAVLPGESLQLKIVKEGREQQQGVGYLEDGTMVIVENGRKLVGQTAEVVVSSVVQGPTGRMMFARKTNGA